MNRSRDDLRDWLANEYESTLEGRVDRLLYIVEEYGPEDGIQLLHGGPLVKEFFEDLRWCYVNAQFVGCIILCQCFFEENLRNLLAGPGPNYGIKDKWLEKAGFYNLIEKAYDIGIIGDEEAVSFHRLRKARNQYVHAKPVFSNKYFAKRVIGENKSPFEVIEDDARWAIKLVLVALRGHLFRV
jgi:hypothetical protein